MSDKAKVIFISIAIATVLVLLYLPYYFNDKSEISADSYNILAPECARGGIIFKECKEAMVDEKITISEMEDLIKIAHNKNRAVAKIEFKRDVEENLSISTSR